MDNLVGFSVVIPLYNKEKHIQRAIRSVLAQTVQDFELIIVDDGSTDGSFEAASAISDPRIRILRQENRGVSAARNRGVAEAQYDWVAFLDADDEWKPEFLEMIVELHTTFPECGVLATSYIRFRASGFDYAEFIRVNYPEGWAGIMEDYYTHLREMVPFCSSSFVVNKKILQKVGGFPIGIIVGEDVHTWIKLYQVTRFAYRKKIGAIYYLDEGNHANKPLHELFHDPQKDYTHGDLLRQILKRKQYARDDYISIVELLAKFDVPIIRKLLVDNHRLNALKRLWAIRSTKIYRKKWVKLLVECFLPKKAFMIIRQKR